MRLIIILITIMLVPVYLSFRPLDGQVEICDNAIDDDGDGQIDLNDIDCECQIAEPVSLIPNPSFEERECCPENRGSLHCADTWIQASEATTDYLHSCGWFGWDNLPVPLPLPDGDACIGFRNGRFGMEPNPNWKEYTGACLSSPLRAGTTYRFQFWLGFTNYESSPPLNVVFYGSSDCKNLPFGTGDERFGCPLNGPGWQQLDQIYAFGSNNWTLQEFNVTPDSDIYAIAIGPDCRETPHSTNPYYFLDNLVLADVKEFGLVISPEGHLCDPEFSLSLPFRESTKYQWYLDGIALVGEIDHRLNTKEEGSYQVLVQEEGSSTCKVTKPYIYNIPEIRTKLNHNICAGETYNHHGRMIGDNGVFLDTFKTRDLCDSIVELNAFLIEDVEVELKVKIFEGEAIEIGHHRFESPTQEKVTITTTLGCDSIINLEVQYYDVFVPNAFSPNNDGINDYFTIFGGNDLLEIKFLSLYDRWGRRIFHANDLTPNVAHSFWPATEDPEGVYTYRVELLMSDRKLHLLSGSVLLIR